MVQFVSRWIVIPFPRGGEDMIEGRMRATEEARKFAIHLSIVGRMNHLFFDYRPVRTSRVLGSFGLGLFI